MGLRWAGAGLGIVLIGSCSTGSVVDAPPNTNSTTIEVGGYLEPGYFAPASDTVNAQATNDSIGITFIWTSPSDGHNLTWDSVPPGVQVDTVPTNAGGLMRTFTLPEGRYTFHCTRHLNQMVPMRGVLVILPPKPTM